MSGRYGGDIRRRGQRSPWRASLEVMEAIGRAARDSTPKPNLPGQVAGNVEAKN